MGFHKCGHIFEIYYSYTEQDWKPPHMTVLVKFWQENKIRAVARTIALLYELPSNIEVMENYMFSIEVNTQ